jgi:hypothetical protein
MGRIVQLSHSHSLHPFSILLHNEHFLICEHLHNYMKYFINKLMKVRTIVIQVMTYVPYIPHYTISPTDAPGLRCHSVRETLAPLLHGWFLAYQPVEYYGAFLRSCLHCLCLRPMSWNASCCAFSKSIISRR